MRKLFIIVLSLLLASLVLLTFVRFYWPVLTRHYYLVRLNFQGADSDDLSLLKDKNDTTISILLSLLDSPNPRRVVGAMRILGAFHCTYAADKVFTLLDSPVREIRETASETLVKIRTEAVVVLAREKLLETQNDDTTFALLDFFYSIGDRDYREVARRKAAGWDREKRFAAVKYLYDESLYPLIRRLSDRNRYIRGDAALVLGFLANPDTLPYLIDLVSDGAFYVRMNLAYALIFFAGEKDFDWNPYERLCADKSAEVRTAVAAALGLSDAPKAADLLSRLSTDPDPDVRYNALRSLIILGNSQAISRTISAVEDSDANVRALALTGVGLLGLSTEKNALLRQLDSKNPAVACAAAAALGLIGEGGGVAERIRPFISNPSSDVRLLAAETLGRAASREDSRVVEDWLSGGENSSAVRGALVWALSETAPETVGVGHLETLRDLYPREWKSAHTQLGDWLDNNGLFVLWQSLIFCSPWASAPAPDAVAAPKSLVSLLGKQDLVFRRSGSGESAGKTIRIGPESVTMDIGGGINATMRYENIDRIQFNAPLAAFQFILTNRWLWRESQAYIVHKNFLQAYDRLNLLVARDRLLQSLSPSPCLQTPALKKLFDDDRRALEDFERTLGVQDSFLSRDGSIVNQSLMSYAVRRYPLLFQEKEKQIRQFQTQADDAARAGQYEKAAGFYRRVLSLVRDNMEVRTKLADVLIRMGDLTAAIRELEDILLLNPRRTDIYLKIASIYRKSRRFDDALRVLENCRANAGENARVLYESALIYKTRGENEKAVEAWTAAIAADPSFFDQYLLLALTQTSLGRYKDALSTINNGLAISPEQPAGRCLAGLLYLYAGDDKKAVTECMESVILTRNNDAEYLQTLGAVYGILGDEAKAGEFSRKAAAARPADRGAAATADLSKR